MKLTRRNFLNTAIAIAASPMLPDAGPVKATRIASPAVIKGADQSNWYSDNPATFTYSRSGSMFYHDRDGIIRFAPVDQG